ncbi:MAG: tRNA (adenosine(37)-N6)-threonylcarbamoyltransferase complex dimerization subunit type 1 TsaB [Candidatus Gracilibacteria bacterium]|nr:tRNA (adenosine(37)-N6)-threonylcarbamoyltransferase complex dimerization subunit type 1 TsaB [Candidatus Gracilibacteria bacterium]
MTLFINTSSSETELALLAKGKLLASKSWESKMNESDKLLPAIADLLSENKLDPSALRKIMVVVGPGSFTGIRVGVSVANTLANSLQLPLLGITNPQLAIYRLDTQENLNKIFIHYALSQGNFFKQNASLAKAGKREGEIVHLRDVDLQVVFSSSLKDFKPEIRSLAEALLLLDQEFAGEKEIAKSRRSRTTVAQPFYVVPPAVSVKKKL